MAHRLSSAWDGVEVFLVNKQSGTAVDLAGFDKENGAKVQGWPLNVYDNQRWRLKMVDNKDLNSAWVIYSTYVNGYCLNAQNGGTADGTSVVNNQFNTDEDSMLWYTTTDSPMNASYPTVQFTNKNSQTCLDLSTGSSNPGTPLIIYHADKGDNQEWLVCAVNNSGPPSPA